ncbi:hypothetical protein [Nonomuraea aurantiaca]|nr:hypothetical protein [Nonomuraea aurantiaca]
MTWLPTEQVPSGVRVHHARHRSTTSTLTGSWYGWSGRVEW